ncbi:RNA-binding protein Lupus La [Corchorus olitorius]|uniref:RNA-binding protein Lupus La n=1 Tax=Corchorus olitorius TaxID=93759 RepID=A0A1R3H5T1_9ROSI|nr:RNA-binding protein Lupus La [Corchorus olitorius]
MDSHVEPTTATAVPTPHSPPIEPVEYYFSDENLPTDKYMMSLIKKNKEGFGKYLDTPKVVNSDGKKVKRRNPLPFIEVRDSKLHALVEYETVEAAEKAAKYGQRRQAWRGPDPEKNSNGRASDHTGDEENNTSNKHQEDIADEEDGEHLSKEKNGHRSRNKGRARRQKNRGTNGMGHGTTFAHPIEPSKPPPGPKMPDGTRGFTMGRGRPLVSKQEGKELS